MTFQKLNFPQTSLTNYPAFHHVGKFPSKIPASKHIYSLFWEWVKNTKKKEKYFPICEFPFRHSAIHPHIQKHASMYKYILWNYHHLVEKYFFFFFFLALFFPSILLHICFRVRVTLLFRMLLFHAIRR